MECTSIKLTKIELNMLLCGVIFVDVFESKVHKNFKLSDIEKKHTYLLRKLGVEQTYQWLD